jgi:RNA polymerase sigma factor (sigma-70 family)
MKLDNEAWLAQLRDDHELVRQKAIEELRKLLLRGLSKSINDRYGKPFSAEDVVQDALLKILQSLDRFDGRCAFTTWAMTIATRIGISSLRRKYHQDVSMEAFRGDDGYRLELPMDANADQDNEGERQRMIEKMQQLIDSELTDRQRVALRAFLDGFSTDGIAERIGTNRNAVYKLIHDARMKIKSGFERAGVSADDVMATFA